MLPDGPLGPRSIEGLTLHGAGYLWCLDGRSSGEIRSNVW